MTKIERIIVQSSPFTFIADKSKHIVLPGFYGVPLYDAFNFFLGELKKSGLNARAKSISFDFAMAIPGVLICIFTVIPYLPISKQFTKELLRLTRHITPNQNSYNFVNSFLTDFLNTPRVGLLSFSFVLVIFYASNAMLSIIKTFDFAIYKQRRNTSFIKKRIKAISLTIVVLGLVIGTILLLIGQGLLFDHIMKWLKIKGSDVLWVSTIRWILTIGLFFYSISFIYKYAPTVKKRWQTISPGSVLATFLMIATTSGFSFWVNHFNNYNKIYGSLGTILILMFLIYLNSLILLIGFELNLSITVLKKQADWRKHKEQVRIEKVETFRNERI
ncbi:YihY/virulence factor BrkB family protein [Segetibacter koreensis]|uniref:YihY/virulence factor BrkB family protein n=1 Tax=Segetibacter koreensis TaxID=398037 RepID=UPI0003811055|nr:YihY/virulence factor BrkB family protein [Segetibacter koreensis]